MSVVWKNSMKSECRSLHDCISEKRVAPVETLLTEPQITTVPRMKWISRSNENWNGQGLRANDEIQNG